MKGGLQGKIRETPGISIDSKNLPEFHQQELATLSARLPGSEAALRLEAGLGLQACLGLEPGLAMAAGLGLETGHCPTGLLYVIRRINAGFAKLDMREREKREINDYDNDHE